MFLKWSLWRGSFDEEGTVLEGGRSRKVNDGVMVVVVLVF